VNLARSLQARGHDVTVIGEQMDDELRAEIPFIPVSVNRLTSWTSNRSFAENAGRAARAGGFDLVYGLGRSAGLDAVRVTERLQAHWVDVHYPHPLRRLVERLNPRHRTLIDLEQTIYRSGQVRRVVTQSELDRRLVIERYGVPEEKVRTIYNGVDTSVFHPGVRCEAAAVRAELGVGADEPLLVFASMDFEGKGLRAVLAALAGTAHRDARLLVLGSGPVRRFSRMASRLGVAQRVIFAGRRRDIQRCYGAGDLFLLPTAYEPFPNVNLEAMACGLPVLTTITAGGADIIRHGENGYLVSGVRAADEVTRFLDEHLRLSRAQRRVMAEHCWATARRLTLERHVDETLRMLEEVLREKSSW
jgi:UDP-glucose:(heptosyl)LPS alpha-1,3-glucosyltransferase